MSAEASTTPPEEPAVPPAAPEEPSSVLGSLQGLLFDLPGAVSDRVELFALELRRAMHALGTMVVLLVGAAIMGFTAWLALWVGGVALAMHFGVAPIWGLLGVLLLNLLGAWLALRRIRALSNLLTLPATLRRLHFGHRTPDPQQEAANDAQT